MKNARYSYGIQILHEVPVSGPFVFYGDNVKIKNGTVIGGDGFSYKRQEDETLKHGEHEYGVVLGDDVHIGSNCVIDRGSWRDTVIQKGCKLDNLCHISHNVIIEPHSLLCAGVIVGGSTIIGSHCDIWMGAKIFQHIHIGDGAIIGAGSIVMKDVPAGQKVIGVWK